MITRKQIMAVNKEFRLKDESHLWPIMGKFNVTEKAIRYLRDFRRDSGIECEDAYEYSAILEMYISEIVNDEKYW